MKFSALFILLWFVFTANAEEKMICRLADSDGRYREHNFDTDSIHLDIRFDVNSGIVFGLERMVFKPIQPEIDSIFLDAPFIAIQSVLLSNSSNRENLKFNSNDKGVSIYFSKKLDWEKSYSIEIKYEAQPRKGLYFIGWKDTANISRKQIWTQGQGIDNRNWFPCYDDVNDKAVTSTSITFDKDYTVVSNGLLLSTIENPDKTKTWNYAMTKPQVPYLVMIAIDKFAYKDYPSKSGVVSRQYYYSDRPQDVAATYRYSSEMMDWMQEELGVPYPWPTYANVPVQDFMYGAMENTTATVFGDFYLHDERAAIERPYLSTNAHELTHQWFGDYITEWSATHHWLHESFATYYAKHFTATVNGIDNYEFAKYNEAKSAITSDEKDRYPVAHSKAGSSRHYPKGSFVIDMLRYVVGDAVFKKTITAYLKKHAYNLVDTHDFFRAFMEHSGVNLDWFFEQWIYRSGFPVYDIRTEKYDKQLLVIVEQKQQLDSLQSLFKMPVNIGLYSNQGKVKSQQFWLQNKIDTCIISIEAKSKNHFIIFDEGYYLIKKTTENKTASHWMLQAKFASHAIDRYLALLALKDIAIPEKRNTLLDVFKQEKADFVRGEVVAQLANDSHPNSIELLKTALADNNFLIRRAALEKMDSIDKKLLPFAEKLLLDTSYITIELALRKLSKAYPERKASYLNQVKDIEGISKNIQIAWLELQIKTNTDAYWKELVQYTSPSYEFRTRTKAMDAIENLNFWNDELINNLLDASVNPNRRLAGPAKNLIKQLQKQTDFDKAYEKAKTNFNCKDWERALLK
jgi:aminopeptidase N